MNDAPYDDVISFVDVAKHFGETVVLQGLHLAVPPATILGLIGPSGCGKTTTVRLATGFHRPDAGQVTILGTDPAHLNARQRTQIGYLPQHPVLFETLSLHDNLNFHASLQGVRFSRRKRLDQLMELVDLAGHERKLVKESSGGMRRRLALAGALVHDPDVLMLDEPTAGIDPILRRRFWEHFRALRDAGTSLVISTQFVDEAAHCDVVAMLAHGRVAAIGAPSELVERARGGRLFDVEFGEDLQYEYVRRLRAHPDVVSVVRDDDRTIGVTARVGGPSVSELCASVDPELRPTVTAERPPNWDDIFISLVGEDASDDVDSAAPVGAAR